MRPHNAAIKHVKHHPSGHDSCGSRHDRNLTTTAHTGQYMRFPLFLPSTRSSEQATSSSPTAWTPFDQAPACRCRRPTARQDPLARSSGPQSGRAWPLETIMHGQRGKQGRRIAIDADIHNGDRRRVAASLQQRPLGETRKMDVHFHKGDPASLFQVRIAQQKPVLSQAGVAVDHGDARAGRPESCGGAAPLGGGLRKERFAHPPQPYDEQVPAARRRRAFRRPAPAAGGAWPGRRSRRR